MIYIDNLVSIITPSYNAEHFIEEAIKSVLRQTYNSWEMIIIDDGSKDSSVEVIRKHMRKDERIRLISLKANVGIANARNVGLNKAKGRYIAFLDSDDIWETTKIENQIAFMKERKIGFSFTQYQTFSSSPENPQRMVRIPARVDYKDLLKGNVIGCLTVMIDRKIIPNIIMANEKHEDYITWLRILKEGYVAYGIQENLALYRVSSTSMSGNKRKSALWTWNIYRNIEKLSLIKSIFYFGYYAFKSIKKYYL